jgi:hypothetical protein
MHGNTGVNQDLCGHQAGGAATDDGNGKRMVHGVFISISAP